MAVTPILSYASCTTVSCSATSVFEMASESLTTITVNDNTSTPLASIVTWKWDLVGIAAPTGWVDSSVSLSGSSGTSVPVSTVMSGLPIGVTGTLALPVFAIDDSGLSFELYNVFALSLTITTSDGCQSKSTITFDLDGNYYNYVLDYENTTASSIADAAASTDCGCGCGCSDICTCVTLTDDTVYGGSTALRADCLVTFAVNKVDANLTRTIVELPAYDPATVTAITVDLDGDSWYEFIMTVTAVDDSFSVNTTKNIMVKCAAEKAYNALLSEWNCSDGYTDCAQKIVLLNANLQVLNYQWCLSNFQGAQRILECINALGTDCGCTDC